MKLLVIALSVLSLAVAKAKTFDALYVIGDSLSTENNGTTPGYYGQGTSNGPMWPEYMSGLLGLDPSTTAADDVAVSGSVTDALQDQIASLPEGDKSKSLVVMWIGTNDVRHVLSGLPAEETFSAAIANIQEGIESLYGLGFRTIIVPNVFNLTQTPDFREEYSFSERMQQRTLIRDFNDRIHEAIEAARQSHPDCRIRYVNVYAKWSRVLNSAGNYGIVYPFSVGQNDPGFISSGDFSLGDVYGSWDGLHPTTTIHRLLAQWFYAVL